MTLGAALSIALGLFAVAPSSVGAQVVVDSARIRPLPDSVVARATGPARIPSRLNPPISSRRAFLYSLALPGFGQSRLDRGTSGALFSSIELASLVMIRRSLSDAREAQRYRIDTLPSEFIVTNGLFVPQGQFTNRYTPDLQRARRLHVEDWLAVLAFNHLFSAADAFVAAQLWDVPINVSAHPQRGGAVILATLRW